LLPHYYGGYSHKCPEHLHINLKTNYNDSRLYLSGAGVDVMSLASCAHLFSGCLMSSSLLFCCTASCP
jgi:hypothetical protein